MTVEQKIRDNLESASDQIRSGQPSDLASVKRKGTQWRRTRTTAWSVAGVLGLGAVVASVGLLTVFDSLDVADGEMVFRTDPPVVHASPGPEPQFDTSPLGEEVVLTPIKIDDPVIDMILDTPRGQILRVVLIGMTSSGSPVWVHNETDGQDQVVCLYVNGGGGCGGGPDEEAARYPNGLLPLEPQSEPYSYGTAGPNADFEWVVSNDVSVAMFSYGSTRLWQRPVGGVAAFEVEDFSLAERYQLTLYDELGNEMDRYQKLANSTGFDCPIIVPQPNGFNPPDNRHARLGDTWFGSAGLWTVLPIDGVYLPRKSVWWSENFPGGDVEESPEITVTWTRLDQDAPVVTEFPGTNAHTSDDGWFMIGGIDPREAGCWEVRAEYKGSSVRYVFENR